MMPLNLRGAIAVEAWRAAHPLGVRARVRPVEGAPYMVTTKGAPYVEPYTGTAMIKAHPDRLETSTGAPIVLPYWLADLEPVAEVGEV